MFNTAAFFWDNTGGKHWDELYRVNIMGAARLLNAAYAAGCGSSCMPEDADDYYRSKTLADREMDLFLVRPPAVRERHVRRPSVLMLQLF
jgi:dihydroflavonol-4-reductase